MDVTIHIDELLVDVGLGYEDAVAAALRPRLDGLLDTQTMNAVATSVAGAVAGAADDARAGDSKERRPARPHP